MSHTELKTQAKKRVAQGKHTAVAGGKLPVAYLIGLQRVIELEAYFRAEKDGFRRSPLDYWLAAENAVQEYP